MNRGRFERGNLIGLETRWKPGCPSPNPQGRRLEHVITVLGQSFRYVMRNYYQDEEGSFDRCEMLRRFIAWQQLTQAQVAILCEVTERTVRRWAARGEGRICMSERKYEKLEYLCRTLWPPGATKEVGDRAIEDYGMQHPRARRERVPGKEHNGASAESRPSGNVAETASPAPVRHYIDDEDEEDEQARLRLKAWIERTYGQEPVSHDEVTAQSAVP